MKYELLSMLHELENYKHSKEELMALYVSERLSKSFDMYDKELRYSIDFLKQKHEKSLLKRINKLDKTSN